MLSMFIEKIGDNKYIIMYVGKNVDPYHNIFSSDKHLYELYADFMESVLDKYKVEFLYICHPNVKKLFSFTGTTYEMRRSQNLNENMLSRVRKKIELNGTSVIYDKTLAAKFRAFLRELQLTNELEQD